MITRLFVFTTLNVKSHKRHFPLLFIREFRDLEYLDQCFDSLIIQFPECLVYSYSDVFVLLSKPVSQR